MRFSLSSFRERIFSPSLPSYQTLDLSEESDDSLFGVVYVRSLINCLFGLPSYPLALAIFILYFSLVEASLHSPSFIFD